ncbi:pentatricopeptide repeat-containing protein At1g02150 [Andrographis paniculata]|uniref:pentatricopeptide repeat-containing protein At1g02150 n=1 Tax=Andrographis paniculata TaxID=175694 RepID=UPI0021E6E274|nr:pentatricopeptide repeat-containing protein At1g02150 [Andrographis paniculata]
MLLQPITSKFALNYHAQNQRHSNSSNAISFSSELRRDSTFSVKQPLVSAGYKTPKSSGLVTCSSISQVHSYGTVDYEKRPMPNWNAIFKKISMMDDRNAGAASALNQVENEGRRITKWELCRVVKELRKFRRYRYALEVYEWMNNRPELYRITTSDTAIQLDLIAKVHGVESAEQYFMKLPDALKDKRIYGSLLNAYVRARMREKAESLMDKIRYSGYAIHALPYNVMMTLYANLKDHNKIESLIWEMKEKGVVLDTYSYNIWLSSCGSQGSLEKMEQAFEQMQLDDAINPNWTTFSTMATMYIKFGHLGKAKSCLREMEIRITGRDRIPYHYLISLYGSVGDNEEVYRIWKIYKATFVNITNFGYHTMISALVRVDDINGAEQIYEEWLSVKSLYDPRVANLLLSSYVKKGLSEKAEAFFDDMVKMGGRPNAMTWEILSENHIRNTEISEALYCMENAASAEGSMSWKPKPVNVCAILKICDRRDDDASRHALTEILKRAGCLDDEVYMSNIKLSDFDASSTPATAEDDDEASYAFSDEPF